MKIDLPVITNYLRVNQVTELSIVDLRDYLMSTSTTPKINKNLLRQKVNRAFKKLLDSKQLIRVDKKKRLGKFALAGDTDPTTISKNSFTDKIRQHPALINRLDALKIESLTLEGALEEYVYLKQSSPELIDILAPEYERTKSIQLKVIGKIAAVEKLLEIRPLQK